MILTDEMLESRYPMGRSEQMGEISEQLIKKRDKVFEAHRLSDEARLILSEHDIEPEETAQKEAITGEDGPRGIRLL